MWIPYSQIFHSLITLSMVVVFVLGTSCRSLVPLGGSVLGGGIGALGGPVSGGIGAGLGYGVGEFYVNKKENKNAEKHKT